MVDMNKFTLTKHDEELESIIISVVQESKEHRILAKWAIECLQRVLPIFGNKYPNEVKVLDTAVETLNKWINNEMKMWDARKYTYEVLALARSIAINDKPYSQIVRATSHCLATCHVPTHAEGTAMYVVSTIKQIHANKADVIELMEAERRWQIKRLKDMMKI